VRAHIDFSDLIIVKIQFKKFTAQNLSEFGEIVATEINFREELQLLRSLTHEVVVKDFVIFSL